MTDLHNGGAAATPPSPNGARHRQDIGTGKRGRTHELRHGYTLQDVNRLARAAAATARAASVYHPDRVNEAWSAIAETLYTSDEPPTAKALLHAAWAAVNQLASDERHHHGTADSDDPGAVRPGFLKYWLFTLHRGPSPEQTAVEVQALHQIWPRLAPSEQRALTALAVHENYADAAASLGLAYHSFAKLLHTGRLKVLALWHEGETPSHIWGGRDARVRPGREPKRPRPPVTVRHKAAVRYRARKAGAA